MKKSFFMLIILFICGLVSADVCIKMIEENEILVSMEMYKDYANAKMMFQDVFWNILYERLKLFLLLGVFALTPIREYLMIIFVAAFSYIWGFFAMTSILGLGIAGIVVSITAVLPHALFYMGLLWMMFRRRGRSYHTKEKIALNISAYIFGILLFITGSVIESLMSTHFIPWVIRLSLI